MDDLFQTIKGQAAAAQKPVPSDPILVHIYPTGPDMGKRYVVKTDPLVIGRGDACDVRIKDNSVSRRHATVVPEDDGYYLVDLESTNGTYLNNNAVQRSRLGDGDYLKVGNCIYRFLMGGNVEAEYHEEIYRLTIIDALTETHNKRYLLEFLDREFARAVRYERPLALVLFDIDHFKRINDSLSHLAGDTVLRQLARCVKGGIRREELFARYGGEEFALVLPESEATAAATAAERVRANVEAEAFEFDGQQIPVTVSVGVAVFAPDVDGPTELIRRADDALYRAKREGRNRVCAFENRV